MKKQLLILGMLCTMFLLLTGCSAGGSEYRSARKHFAKGNYEEAAVDFAKSIEQNPNRAEYYIDYGMTLIALEQYEDALKQFDQVYMDKLIPMVQKNNQKVLRGKGITYYFKREYEEAIRQFDAALSIGELSDLNLDILYYKGNALRKLGAYEEAAEVYTEIIEQYSKTAEALSKRAYTWRKTGDFVRSLEDCNLAISMKPNHYEYYFDKYKLMVDMGDMSEATNVLMQASEIGVDSKEDQYNMAKVHFYQGSYEVALTELNESYANGFYEANYYIGEIYSEQKDFSTAIYYYEKYIEEGHSLKTGRDQGFVSGATAVYHQIAICHMKQGNYSQALKYLEQGIAFEDIETLRPLMKSEIIAYEYMGQYDMALEKLASYMEAYPEDEEARRELLFLDTRQLDLSKEQDN